MRILVVGDVHGNSSFMNLCFEQAKKRNCQKIVQVGDFGYWLHTNWGREFISNMRGYSALYDIPLYWIDGNHDNHPDLWAIKDFAWDEFVNTGENTWYIPRGHSWEWDGLKFLGMGGAWSIDKDMRTPGYSWWETELIRDIDVDRVKDEKVDVMFTHDTISFVKVPGISPIRAGELNREKIDEIVKRVRPELLIHGHYHRLYKDVANWSFSNNGKLDWHKMDVIGLDCDNYKGEYWRTIGVLDTEKFDSSEKRFGLS